MSGIYTGFVTHRGRILLSYQNFPGAKALGVADGNKIKIELDKKRNIYLQSSTAFLPHHLKAKVYVLIDETKKSKGPQSVRSFDSNKIESIQRFLKE